MKIKHYKIVSSTNAMSKELKNPLPWSIILADEQTAGYGRAGNSWFSPKGGLYFSLILPQSKIEDLQTLTILAAFVVARLLKENYQLEPLIKLPNDIYLDSKKVCGILTENVVGKDVKFSVMGIGLNTNTEKFPKELEEIVTSIKIETRKEVDNKKILKQIVERLKEQLKTISE